MKAPLPSLKSITLGEANSRETCNLLAIWQADYDNVAQAAEELPSIISWLNYHFAMASEEADLAERKYKEEEARIYFELRNGGFESMGYGEKATEKALDRAVILEKPVQIAAQKSERALRQVKMIKGQIMAIQAKLDLIRTSEATRRRVHEAPVSDDEIRMPRNEQEE